MRHMTARMANPSQRALKKRDPTPKEDFSSRKGGERGVSVARARGTDTSNLSAAQMAEVISPDKPLTEKQKLFVEHWAKGDSLPNACLRAGYSDDGMAYRLIKMPNILKLKAEYEAKYEADAQMSRKKVMDGFLEAIDMAKLMAEPATMISGWTAVAKMCGYMAPIEHKMKVDVTGNVTMQKLTAMSDAELLEMIERGPRNDGAQLLTDQTDGRAAL